ncbi:MAG: hypothetical protein Q9181_007336, partial [Wetmoreana brouardii]
MTSFSGVPPTITPQEILNSRPVLPPKPFTDPTRLAPHDAIHGNPGLQTYIRPINGAPTVDRPSASVRRRRDRDRGRSGSRRAKGEWKKLLWVKQPKYPDNYTDPPTFLSHLQRNPRLQPYDFWPLVADSTVIVQHLSSVAIFVCCFVGIYQEKISPVSVISLGSICTILGWFLWDFWVGQAEAAKAASKLATVPDLQAQTPEIEAQSNPSASHIHSRASSRGSELSGLGLTMANSSTAVSGNDPTSESTSVASATSSTSSPTAPPSNGYHSYPSQPVSEYPPMNTALSIRNQQRLATAKSAILITCALLGVSPILKSLTMSTSSDSIWAISASLMCIHIFFFDYGGGISV